MSDNPSWLVTSYHRSSLVELIESVWNFEGDWCCSSRLIPIKVLLSNSCSKSAWSVCSRLLILLMIGYLELCKVVEVWVLLSCHQVLVPHIPRLLCLILKIAKNAFEVASIIFILFEDVRLTSGKE